MPQISTIGFDYPLPNPGVALRRDHWSTEGLRALLLPNSGSPSIRVFDYARGVFPPEAMSLHAGTNVPTANGLMGFASSNGGIEIVSDSTQIIPTTQITVLAVKRKTDSTLRGMALFGIDGGASGNRCGAHVPWNDGVVYWDFGGSSGGTTEVATGVLTWTVEEPSSWAFVAGPHGMAIYKDGVLLASHATAAGRTATTVPFSLNQGNAAVGDLIECSFFAVLDAEWNAQQVAEWSQNQAIMFTKPFRSVLAMASVTGPIIARAFVGRQAVQRASSW